MSTVDDGTGTGRKAGVSAENRLNTDSVTSTFMHHVNWDLKEYYTLSVSKSATAADDVICYIKNTDDNDMHINGMWQYSTSATIMTVKLGDSGTAAGGTAIVPTNCNAGSGITATGTFEEGVDITGLSGGVVAYKSHNAASAEKELVFAPHFILPTNKIATFYCSQSASTVQMVLGFGYHE